VILLVCTDVQGLGGGAWTATFAPRVPTPFPGEVRDLQITVPRDNAAPWPTVGQLYEIAFRETEE